LIIFPLAVTVAAHNPGLVTYHRGTKISTI